MKVKLNEEWLGTPKGSIVDVIPYIAQSLIDRKVGVEVDADATPPRKLMRRQKDKMIHTSENKMCESSEDK